MTTNNKKTTPLSGQNAPFTNLPILDKTEDDILALLWNAVEQTADSLVITDIDGRIVYVNPAFETITGYSQAEALGQTPALLKSGQHPPEMYAELWQAVSNGRSFKAEFVNRKKDGQLYYQEQTITPIKNGQGEIVHYVASGREITERKQIEQALRQRNEDLAALNELNQRMRERERAMQTAVSTVNSTLALNEVLDRILATIGTVIVCHSASIILLNEQGCYIAASYNLPPPVAEQLPVNCTNLLLKEVAATKRPLILKNAQEDERFENWADTSYIKGWLCVPLLVRDKLIGFITLDNHQPGAYTDEEAKLGLNFANQVAVAVENARLHEDLQTHFKTLRQAQERLVQSEKLAAIGELVAGVAHELNNPLAAVVLHAQLLRYKAVDNSLAKEVAQIVSQAQRASNIVRGLLDFARQRPTERKPVALNKVMDSALSLVAYEFRASNITCNTHYPPDMPPIMGDAHQLQQVFVNLLTNAHQAIRDSQDEGRILITTEVGPSLYLGHAVTKQPLLRLKIEDDGPGIPQHLLTRIFDPFFTTKPAGVGTGIGLSVCHGIVSDHGGYIWAESKLGQGTIFWLELPLAQEADLAQAASAEQTVVRQPVPASLKLTNGSGAAILIIDDEASLRHVMGRSLEKRGYQVTIAASGQEGLDRLAEQSYDLILCDIRMPGMDGVALHRHLQADYPAQAERIVFMTGDIVSPQTRQFLQETAVHHLEKPFELEELIALTEQFLQQD